MKILTLGLLLFVLAAGGLFAETSLRIATDAENLLGIQEDRSASNHLFLETSLLLKYENRVKLNDYRVRFNAISARILALRNQVTNALQAREPRIDRISNLRGQLESLIGEHDALLSEFRQWVSTLRE